MRDTDLVNKLRTHLEAARKIGLYQGKSGIWAVIEQAADRIANQNTHILALQREIEGLRAQNEQLRGAAALVAKESAELLEQRWIPVTERLPEKQGWYHVAIRDEKTKRVAVELDSYAIETAKNFGHKPGFCKDGRWDGREKVVAWMPLPEPPKEDKQWKD